MAWSRRTRRVSWVLVGLSSMAPSISLIDRSTRSSLRSRLRRFHRSSESSPRRVPVVAADPSDAEAADWFSDYQRQHGDLAAIDRCRAS